MTALVLVLSLVLPKTYTAEAHIVLDDIPGLTAESVESVQRQLATFQKLITTRPVLTAAGARLSPPETADSLEDKVTAAVDPNANLITVSGSDNDAERAAAVANAVAAEFLAARSKGERARLARTRAELLAALRALGDSKIAASRAQAQALRDRLSDLSVSEATVGSDLQLAQLARPPEKPSSPKPVRNTAFAFVASLFLGALAALAKAHFAPNVRDARELGRLAGVPVLGAIPRRRLRRADARDDGEAFGSLQAAVLLRLPAERQQVLLVTSAEPEEGKSEITAQLGRAFAAAGIKTLLVSADLRRPTLHSLFGVDEAPGLADLLEARLRGDGASPGRVIWGIPDAGGQDALGILPSGGHPTNPSGLLASTALGGLFDELAASDYRYIIVDGPPLVASVDVEALARRAANVLLVVRADRVSPERLVDAGDLLRSFGANTIGLVAVGAKTAHY
jgi:non-specific protein-tyrosine kinase